MKKIVTIAVLSFTIVLAQQADPLAPKNFKPLNELEALNANNNNVASDLTIKKFYLDINKTDIKGVQGTDTELKRAFDQFDDALINRKPVIRPISSIDTIMIHPYFSTTFLLPKGAEISYVDLSTPFETLKHDQNTILIRPKADFDIANLTALYSLNGKNYVMNLILKRYKREDTEDRLNLIHSYREVAKLEDLDVVSIYTKVYKKLPTRDYNYVYVDDILYRIIKDNDFGTVMIEGNKYRIDIGTVY